MERSDNVVIWISNNNTKPNIENEDIDYILGVKNIKKLVVQDIKNMSYYNTVILDINNYKDKKEIQEVVKALRLMYDMKIIIWATNYKYTDEIIVNLYRNGIYNFVIAEEQEEQIKILKQLLAKENSYNDIKQKFEATNNIENLEKSYRKTRNNCKIGICGSQHHIGVTLQSIQLAKFLSNLGFNVCYIQSNNSEDIQYLNGDKKEEYFKLNGIDVYCKDIDILDMKYGYDFYIYDVGIDINKLENMDLKVIICGMQEWEYENTKNILKRNKKNQYKILLNFVSYKYREKIIKQLKNKNVMFINYSPNLYEYENNRTMYLELLKDNVKAR